MGLQDGDLITHINGNMIIDWDDVSVAIDNMEVGHNITITYQRNGKTEKGEVAIKSYCDTKQEKSMGLRSAPNIIIRETVDKDQKLDLSLVEVDLTNLSSQETESMKRQYGIEMISANTLLIRNLDLEPDPHEGMFNLEFELPQQGSTLVRVFNSSGRMIYEYDLGDFSGKFSDQLDIAQNGLGAYFLEIRQNDKQISKKIVVQQS